MEIYLVVRRKSTSVFLEAKENWKVLSIKAQLTGILNVPAANQQLHKDDTVLEDSKTLSECGLNVNTAKAQSPAQLVLAILEDGEEFEKPGVTEYSQPPDLPDVMKPQTPTTAITQSD
ncbi:elongin-B-like [Sycon ciliatum]|uniref:elongin-B-like n=1 Tax=Sycon ciliatum TaxID=27933 RepID=UPI0031F65972|eukprot:scpid79698/ scgid13212/ Transcription elongation factor B polypeptide 2; Elongin 18 kDa subunit; Elongin-B; RNA polymerase II transcription factor SIII subunit B; SIII p18 &gt; Transcription elongation factor B polypeptide 2; Elongin 18 kDa subunit; Elongin-B; RNA polymerase II transcription factor SIII subunit B; SIII p18